METKTQTQLLKEKLFYTKELAYDKMSDAEIKEDFDFCEEYKNFLDKGKTERCALNYIESRAQKAGFKAFEYKKSYKAGDKIFINKKGKTAALIVIGKEPLENGLSIAAAHIDSPRLDLKPNPVYEDLNLCLFKTHYYGGIKKT